MKDINSFINENNSNEWTFTQEQMKLLYSALCFVDASVKREELCKVCNVDTYVFDELMEDLSDEIKNPGSLSGKISKLAD